MTKDWALVGLIALAGFLLGGIYTTWKTAKVMAIVLAVAAALAIAGTVAWYLS